MNPLSLSKPLYALLLVSAGLSLVTVLIPDQPRAIRFAPDQPVKPVTTIAPVLADTPLPLHWRRELEPVSPRALEPPGYVADTIQVVNDPPASGRMAEPPPPPEVPPPALAPPPPFTYLGRIIDNGKTVVLLGREEGGEAVSLGSIVDGTWQVRDANETRVELVYLPLNEARQLAPN